ncbi:MAG: baseplate multidomain protein megatron, partial [Beijerinckiaceae bacterium]
YPWRGTLTVDPAPGRADTADGTAAASTQVAAFMGQAAAANFTVGNAAVTYTGANEWSLRRFVLHYAALASAAGGVDGFIIGSEMRSLTRVRGATGGFPMTQALADLAVEVRALIGAQPVVTYGADWTEYGGVVPEAGTLMFPLDALWAHPAISCIGIDWYPPLSDWRDGQFHADASVARSVLDKNYLEMRVAAGENFDWYYADDVARMAQARTPITDGVYGKPWVYRAKDLAGWWSNVHVPRAGGVETAPTAWQPGIKPVWLLEIGCPAVDRGANAPNIFPDAKSSAAGLPYASRGYRDDLMQARAVAATLDYFDPSGQANAARNPVSSVYGGRMVDAARIHVWAWDARPYPEFPALADLWGDAENYERGHWLNGRIEGAPLDELLRAIADDFDLADLQSDELDHFVEGYVIDRPMSFRAAVEPLARLFGFGLGDGRLRFTSASGSPALVLTPDDCVPERDGALWDLRRAQETELPAEFTAGFSDSGAEFRRATAIARREGGKSQRQRFADTALVARRSVMHRLAAAQLHDAWLARETVEFALPPNRIEIETGDIVALQGQPHLFQIITVRDGATRAISARAIDPSMFERTVPDILHEARINAPAIAGIPSVEILDLPVSRSEPAVLQHAAISADPWPGAVTVWRREGETEFVAQESATARAGMGVLLDALPPGKVWRWDRATAVRVAMTGTALATIDDPDALAGGNSFAVRKPSGAWEILSAAQAVLESPGVWRLSHCLRGLAGSEGTVSEMAPVGARIVKLDAAIIPLTDELRDAGQAISWRFAPAGVDHADPRAIEVTAIVPLLALRPLPAVHVKARRTAQGVQLTWIRQTRGDGDNWELADV